MKNDKKAQGGALEVQCTFTANPILAIVLDCRHSAPQDPLP